MKRFIICALAVASLVAFVAPAFALHTDYGGYFRARAWTQEGFTGDGDDESLDFQATDIRGRIWAKFQISEEISWLNRIEINALFGDEDNGGGIGTDGTDNLRWKHSFVDWTPNLQGDFNLGVRVGLQGFAGVGFPLGQYEIYPYQPRYSNLVGRGFIFDDDYAGIYVNLEYGNIKIPFVWMKAYEGAVLAGDDDDLEDYDVDYYMVAPFFNVNEQLTINPYAWFITSNDASNWDAATGNEAIDVFLVGADLDYRFGAHSLWLTGVYEFGEAENRLTGEDMDVKAFLVAGGAELDMGRFGIHGEAFYASGDDDASDDDVEAFGIPQGQSYYWSEIMGLGYFDYNTVSGSPGDVITNLWAVNIGADYDVNDKLNLRADLWYAERAETNEFIEDAELGTEINLMATYALTENVDLSAVGAYLFAGDGVNMDADDDVDPWEVGLRLDFRFDSSMH